MKRQRTPIMAIGALITIDKAHYRQRDAISTATRALPLASVGARIQQPRSQSLRYVFRDIVLSATKSGNFNKDANFSQAISFSLPRAPLLGPTALCSDLLRYDAPTHWRT